MAEFLRYTSAPGQEKLPVHPIYIAIQRLLAEIVTRESASDQFEHARQSLTTGQDQMEACVVDVAEWDSASTHHRLQVLVLEGHLLAAAEVVARRSRRSWWLWP